MGLTDLPTTEVFNLFLFTGVEWPGTRTAEIIPYPADNRDLGRSMVAAIRAGKTLADAGKLASESARIALVDRCVGAAVRSLLSHMSSNAFKLCCRWGTRRHR